MARGRKGIAVVITPKPTVNGQVKSWYPSMTACAKELGLQPSHISEVCSGKRKAHKGYVFSVFRRKDS